MDEMTERSVYLTKDGEIVGIHAVGYEGPYEYQIQELDGTLTQHLSDFMIMEIWGNNYDENRNILGRGSFRVSAHNFELEVKDWESEGWVRREAPIKKESNEKRN